MARRRMRLVGVVLSLVLLAVLASALPASASPKRILYSGGHPLDEFRLSFFGGHTLVDTFDGNSDAEWATALARTDYDVIVVGETQPGAGLNAATESSIANYVRGGRLIVVTGAHNDEDDFLNAIFGYSTTHEAHYSDGSATATLQPGAAGTPFAGGPPTLTSLSDTEILGSTPGKTIYAGADGTWVFQAPFGSGFVNYLAWDLCGAPDTCGNPSGVEDDWYRVIDRALQFPVTPAPPAAPGTCKGTTTTLLGTQGADVLTGTPNRDVIAALGGNDKVFGLAGNDLICGNKGNDKLVGGKGKDKLFGQKGNDKLKGGGGNDICKGGAGKDSGKCEVEKSV
jgi:Ca2+-binding RTX toxin-like protein